MEAAQRPAVSAVSMEACSEEVEGKVLLNDWLERVSATSKEAGSEGGGSDDGCLTSGGPAPDV